MKYRGKCSIHLLKYVYQLNKSITIFITLTLVSELIIKVTNNQVYKFIDDTPFTLTRFKRLFPMAL